MTEAKLNSKNFLQSAFVLFSSIAVWLIALLVFKPWVTSFYSIYFTDFAEGPRYFLKHTFIFSTPTALLCFVWFIILQKSKLIQHLSFSFSRKLILTGLIWGMAISLFTLAIAPVLGLKYSFHFNPWSIAGNFTSNLCEEIIFRGLLFFAFWRSFGSKPIAIFLSGVAFGLSHEQYPWHLKTYIAGIGALLSYLTANEKNLVPAIIAHDISDWILDLFL